MSPEPFLGRGHGTDRRRSYGTAGRDMVSKGCYLRAGSLMRR